MTVEWHGGQVHVFKKIAIFGVGLIGGSLALALKRAGMVEQVVGISRTAASLARAETLGIIDAACVDVEQALNGAELVLIAAPVAQSGTILSAIAPYLAPGVVVTDAGSTKCDVVASARAALGEKVGQFVPGHPIAGSEMTGPDAAVADLYVGKKVVLTPIPENRPEDVLRVEQMWQQCGALTHQLTPEQHDAVFAAVSHLPHVLAFALVDEVARRGSADLLFQYAASGFRDFTRIAASSPEMWRDVSMANRIPLIGELDAYMAQLEKVRNLLVTGDGAGLEEVYARAQQARQRWGRNIEADGAVTQEKRKK